MKIKVTAQNLAISITEGSNTLLDFKVDGYQFSADVAGLIASATRLLEPNTGGSTFDAAPDIYRLAAAAIFGKRPEDIPAEDIPAEDTPVETSKASADTGCVIHAIGPGGKLKHYRSFEELLADILH